jgi:hypothetical protein
MQENKKTARTAGFIYLIVILNGFFFLKYVPSRLIVWNDPATTLYNIRASETLFRLGILSEIIGYTAWLLLPLVLYRLLKPVNKTWAVLMLAFAIAIVPIAFSNLENKYAVLTLLDQANSLKGPESDKLPGQVLKYLQFYDNGNQISSVFWGLWLLPFGYLVFRSGFIPRVLGILLMFGCLGYLTIFTGNLLFPGNSEMRYLNYIRLPGSIGELGICLWLMVVGVKDRTEIPAAKSNP